MASQPIPLSALTFEEQLHQLEGEPPLSAEEGWKLIYSLFGSARVLFAEYGGGEAFLRAERASWGEDLPE